MNFEELEEQIKTYINKDISIGDLQDDFRTNFERTYLPAGYDIDGDDKNFDFRLRRLQLKIVFLKLIAELDLNKLKNIEALLNIMEQDIPEWSGLDLSPFITKTTHPIIFKIHDDKNKKEVKDLFNLANNYLTIIRKKYRIIHDFYYEKGEKFIEGFKDKRFAYVMSYTKLLNLIKQIKENLSSFQQTKKQKTGGKLRNINPFI